MEYNNLDVLDYKSIKYEQIAAEYGYTIEQIDEMPALMFFQFIISAKTRKANEQMRLAQAIAILRSGSDKCMDHFYQLFERMTPEDYEFFFHKPEDEEEYDFGENEGDI